MGFTEEQIATLLSESSLVTDGHHYSSRRERIAAHLMAALIVGSGHGGVLSLNRPQARADLVAMALELTDTLIVQLAEDSDSLAANAVIAVKP